MLVSHLQDDDYILHYPTLLKMTRTHMSHPQISVTSPLLLFPPLAFHRIFPFPVLTNFFFPFSHLYLPLHRIDSPCMRHSPFEIRGGRGGTYPPPPQLRPITTPRYAPHPARKPSSAAIRHFTRLIPPNPAPPTLPPLHPNPSPPFSADSHRGNRLQQDSWRCVRDVSLERIKSCAYFACGTCVCVCVFARSQHLNRSGAIRSEIFRDFFLTLSWANTEFCLCCVGTKCFYNKPGGKGQEPNQLIFSH